MRIEVYRGAGDAVGDDVTEPMLGTLPALLERGRNELDELAHQKNSVDLDIVPKSGIRLGQLAKVADNISAGWIGKVTGIGISYSDAKLSMRINAERPL